jgi:uncharacterized protein YndB with AHSA1/START domain
MATDTTFDVPEGRQEIIITRRFAASARQVFAAHTDADLIPRWWGPRYLTTTVDRLDPVPGGKWRYVQVADDGATHAFHGYFHLVEPSRRLISTFEYEGTPGHVLLNDVLFQEHDGHTQLVQKSVYLSVAERDAMVLAGMRIGLEHSMERLDELFAVQTR